MGKLTIISEKLPTRCEICHKTDQFDIQTGYCSRCTVIVTDHTTYNLTKYKKSQINLSPKGVIVELKDTELKLINPSFCWDTINGLIFFIIIALIIAYKVFIFLGIVLIVFLVYI